MDYLIDEVCLIHAPRVVAFLASRHIWDPLNQVTSNFTNIDIV